MRFRRGLIPTRHGRVAARCIDLVVGTLLVLVLRGIGWLPAHLQRRRPLRQLRPREPEKLAPWRYLPGS